MIRSSILVFVIVALNVSFALAQSSEPILDAPALNEPTFAVEPLVNEKATMTGDLVPVETVVLVCENTEKSVEVVIKDQSVRFASGADPYLTRHSIQLKVGGVLADQMTPACNGVCQPGQHCAATVGQDRYVVYPNRIKDGFKGGTSVIVWKKDDQAQQLPLVCRQL